MQKSILFADQFGEVAGGQVVLQALLRVAHGEGYKIGVLAPMGGGLEKTLREQWGEELNLYHLDEIRLSSARKGPGDAARLAAYCRYILRFRKLVSEYDAVYVNGARLALPFFLLSKLTAKPRWYYHVHLCHSALEKRLLGYIANSKRTSQVIMASKYIQEDFARSSGTFGSNARISVVENCLNHPFSDMHGQDRFGAQAGPLTVALIGRVSPEKGHDILPALAKRFPDVRFVMIGRVTEENRPFLDSIVGGAPENLVYAGETADLPGTLDKLHVQVSLVPSRWEEPFGLVSIESMAASCITLVSNRGMLPKIAQTTGAFCFKSDEELVKLLEGLRTMASPALYQLARGQYTKALRHFGFEDFRRKVLAILEPASPVRLG